MSKINIKIRIQNEEGNIDYNTQAILQEEVIKYKEPDGTMTIFDLNRNTLERDNKDFRMHYRFILNEKTNGSLEVKELGKIMDLQIKTNKLERKNNNIMITYEVEDNSFLYCIEEIK